MEKIHHSWSFGSDATVLDDYAPTTTNECDCKKYTDEWGSIFH